MAARRLLEVAATPNVRWELQQFERRLDALDASPGRHLPTLHLDVSVVPDDLMRERTRTSLNRVPDIGDWEPGNELTDILRELRQPVVVHRKSWEYGMCLLGLQQLGGLGPDSAVIAVGAGTEPVLYHFANIVSRVVATDLYDNPDHEGTPAMLRDPTAFAPFPYREDRLEVHRMSGDDLRFADGEFDACFCLSSIEHFGSREVQRAALSEMIRVTRVGGIVCIITELILTRHHHHEYFSLEEVRDIFLSDPRVELVGGDPDLSISESHVRYPVDLTRSQHISRSPHIVLAQDGMLWTSLSLFLRKR